nr:leaf rust 10 disease-resistance locus receptor-like protein kinase-like 1.1 [Tanacetum cinerariifolium]
LGHGNQLGGDEELAERRRVRRANEELIKLKQKVASLLEVLEGENKWKFQPTIIYRSSKNGLQPFLSELISSKVVVDLNMSKEEINLANLALIRIQICEVYELIDSVLVTDSNRKLMKMITSVAELAFRCLQYDSEMRPTMSEVLDVLMDIQAEGRPDDDLRPSSKTNDIVVLLKNFPPSPVSDTDELQSENSASTTISSSGDRSAKRNMSSGSCTPPAWVETTGAPPPLPLPPTFTIRSSMIIFSASLTNKPVQYDSKVTLTAFKRFALFSDGSYSAH